MGTGGPFKNKVRYSDGREETITVPYPFSLGDVVAVTHRRDGGVVVQRVSPVQFLDITVRVDFGGASPVEFSASGRKPWTENQLFYGLPVPCSPFNFQYIEFEATNGSTSGTCRSVGVTKDFSDPLALEQVLSLYVMQKHGHIYIDSVQFLNYSTSEIWDLDGIGGFETGDDDWNMTGSAEITTTQYYEGSHSLMLL